MPVFFLKVISLGDIIKFSLSPSKTKDRLSTNVPGVPLDDSNLVWHNILLFVIFLCIFGIIILEFYTFADHKGT